jgi:RNA polymerase sigma factor (TIGR02999 family)
MLNNSEIVQAIEQRDAISSERLLPLVYDQLLLLARQRLARDNSGNSFDSCDLVHEAYLRLKADGRQWDNRGHFFAAAADEMRRILIDHKRRMRRVKHGGDRIRVELPEPGQSGSLELEEFFALQEALEALQQKNAKKAELVKLRYFAGLTLDEAAALLQISRTTANRYWSFSRAWLFNRLQDRSPQPPGEPEPPAASPHT